MPKLTQHEMILDYLDDNGTITPMEAFYQLGITKLATRISEMRKNGIEFDIRTVESKNRYGNAVRCAQYALKEVM